MLKMQFRLVVQTVWFDAETELICLETNKFTYGCNLWQSEDPQERGRTTWQAVLVQE